MCYSIEACWYKPLALPHSLTTIVSSIEELIAVMAQLRDPDEGCSWDLQQSFASIAPYTIEEAYEVADAIARNNLTDLQDELGDLLLQVVFHSQMAQEQAAFNFDDVASTIVAKLIRRHPHIFSDAKYDNPEDVKAAWETVKAQERAQKNQTDESALADVALALPALSRADKIQDRAVASGDAAAVEDEIGDLLFTVVNLARHLKINPEVSLSRSTAKFEKRFRQVEQLAARQNSNLTELDLAALDALWDRAKKDRQ